MQCIVVYDIPKTKIRKKVADACLDYGLTRIQFSAFMGELNSNRQGELFQKIKRKVGQNDANVQIIPVCARDMEQRKELSVNGYLLGQSVH
jgi:CRISPR-associated protein Cas2